MRANTPEILLAAALALLAPAAYARPHKPAPRPVHTSRAPARRATPAASKTHAAAKKTSKHTVPGAHEHAAPARGSRGHAVQHPLKRQAQPAPRVARQQPAQPVPPAPELPPIHVTHDRKQHLAPTPPQADVSSRDAAPVALLSAAPKASPGGTRSGVSHPQTNDERAPRGQASQAFAGPGKQAEAGVPALPQIQAEPIAALYTSRGRLIMPPALKGSHEILLRQNEVADQDGLLRVQDDDDLERMRLNKVLVAIPGGAGIQTDERLPANRRYCRPWTALFLTELARAHYARFHTPLQVNSAVRTVDFQQKLLRTNGNAAPANGETASPHLTGQAVDLAKHGLSLTEIAWLRGYLLRLVQEGKVDVEEEFQQACFHISVYRKYMPQPGAPRNISQKGGGAATTLAVAIP